MEAKTVFIDAKDMIAGRIASYAAKNALLGNYVVVVNCEKAIMTGTRKGNIEKYLHKRTGLGQPTKGPFVSRMPDRFFRRIVRGMLPWKKARGIEAFKRIKCYVGVPEIFKEKRAERLSSAEVSKLKNTKYSSIGEICKYI